jgi:hypothetical protein
MQRIRAALGSLVSAAVLAGSATSANASPTFPCFSDDEMQSARIHDLQVMMMVGALKCRDVAPAALRQYGAFVTDRNAELTAHGERVRESLIASFGPEGGREAFDDYETGLSNYHSAVRHDRAACSEIAAFARLAHLADADELHVLSRLATNRAIDRCRDPSSRELTARYGAGYDVSREDDVRVIRGAVPPQIAEMEVGAEELVTREIPMLDDLPVVEPVAAATIAATAPAAAPAGSDPDRLEAAIDALDRAANALRDLRGADDAAQAQ